MKRLILAGAVALSLGGCAQLTNAWNAVTSTTVDPTLVIVAGNTVDALEATTTNYLKLPKCTGSNGPVCRDPAATKAIIPAVRSMRVARNNLEQFLTDHPGQLATQGLYDAVQAAIKTVQGIIAQYNIGATK
jgi:hypothetical protein